MAKGEKQATKAADSATSATDTATDTAETATDSAQGAGEGAKESSDGVLSELGSTAREAALAVLKPAVKSAAETAAKYAVDKGPDLVKDKLDAQGGVQELADKALSNAGGLGKVASKLGVGGKLVEGITGGDDDDGDSGESELDATGSGRRMPIQQAVDIAVPLETVYNQWTQFEEYPNFMFRVDSASQDDETHVTFTEKVWGFGREFEAEITEQRPYERIVWRSVNGLKHSGVVTFHELAERLTRVEVTVDFKPESLFQKFARGARFSKRAIRSDLHRFKAYLEMAEEEDGAWLGRIEEGEVVGYEEPEGEAESEEEDAQAAEEQPQDEAGEASEEDEDVEDADVEDEDEDEESEAESSSEPEADEEPQAEEDGDTEEDEAPARSSQGGQRRTSQRRAPKRPQRPARRRSGQQQRPTRARTGSANGGGQGRSSGSGQQRQSRSKQRTASGR